MKISGEVEKYINQWMLMEDNPGSREFFPEDSWYGKDPLRIVVLHVGIDKLRKLGKKLDKKYKEKK